MVLLQELGWGQPRMTRALRPYTNSDAVKKDFKVIGTLLSRSRHPGAGDQRDFLGRGLLCLSGEAAAAEMTACALLLEKEQPCKAAESTRHSKAQLVLATGCTNDLQKKRNVHPVAITSNADLTLVTESSKPPLKDQQQHVTLQRRPGRDPSPQGQAFLLPSARETVRGRTSWVIAGRELGFQGKAGASAREAARTVVVLLTGAPQAPPKRLRKSWPGTIIITRLKS